MVQAGNGFRFALKALPQRGIAGKVRRKNLIRTRMRFPPRYGHASLLGAQFGAHRGNKPWYSVEIETQGKDRETSRKQNTIAVDRIR
jgi:hypothetical protein